MSHKPRFSWVCLIAHANNIVLECTVQRRLMSIFNILITFENISLSISKNREKIKRSENKSKTTRVGPGYNKVKLHAIDANSKIKIKIKLFYAYR